MTAIYSDPELFEVWIPFEPVTPRTGLDTTARKVKLRNALLGRIKEEDLQKAREKLRNRVVKLVVVFRLWKPPPNVSDTRWIKDIDNLLKILFDVLGSGKQGLSLVHDDSYICEVHATKILVTREDQEGYIIRIHDHSDDQMHASLKESFSKREESLMKRSKRKQAQGSSL